MRTNKLIEELCELAKWADANIYQVPIMLPDCLRTAVIKLSDDSLYRQETTCLYEYPFVESNPMFAIGWCEHCHKPIREGQAKFCCFCGARITGWRHMTDEESKEMVDN